MSGTRIHDIWCGMRARCLNPNDNAYSHYGGRGISICDRWDSFEAFFADMGDCPPKGELERIDNSGNYEPGNCRWATRAEQMRNTRRTNFVEYADRTWCMTDLAAHFGISVSALKYRIRMSWPQGRWNEAAKPGGWGPRRGHRLASHLEELTN